MNKSRKLVTRWYAQPKKAALRYGYLPPRYGFRTKQSAMNAIEREGRGRKKAYVFRKNTYR